MKKIALTLFAAAAIVGSPAMANRIGGSGQPTAYADDLPPPYGCYVVLGKVICLDLPD